MKLQRHILVRAIAFSLLVSLFSPVQSATSVETMVTKTITVRGADDSLLVGAKVKTYWQDLTTSTMTFGTIATTNSSGVAVVTIPINSPGANYAVFPPAGDTTNAIQADSGLSSTADEAIAVKLVLSNFILNIQRSDGTAPGDGAVITYPSDSGGSQTGTTLARSGAFGIRLPNDLSTTKDYNIGLLQYTEAWMSGQFSWRYGLKAAGASGSQTYTVYTDTTMTTTVSPSGSTYVLQYTSGNINGTLKKADGTTLTLTSGMEVNVSIAPTFSTTFVYPGGNDRFNATTSPNANWKGRVRGPAGKYKVNFNISGSLTIPSFSAFLWKNSSGGFSTTEGGTYTTTNPASLEFRLPSSLPNFAYKVVLSGTSTAVPVYPYLEVKTPGTSDYTYVGGGQSLNGMGSAALIDGEYRLTIEPLDQSLSTIIATIVVSAGAAVVRNSSNQIVDATAGVYTFSPSTPNVKFRAVSASNTSTVINNSWIEVFKNADGSGGLVNGRDSGSTSAGFNLADGTYMVRANPGDWQLYKEKTWVVTVASGVATIPDLTASDKVFSLPLPTKNLQFHLQSPTDSSPLTTGWIDYCVWDASTSQRTDCMGDGVNSSGNGGGVLGNGTYLITVYPGSGNTFSPKTYVATVVAGVVTAIVGSTKDENGRWVLSAASANVTGTLKASNGTSDLVFANGQGVSLDVQRYENGNWQWMNLNSWRTSATWGFNITDAGHYRILARPQGFPDLSFSFGPDFWVNANGKMSTDNEASSANGSTSLTGMNITIRASNLKMKITDPRDSSMLKFGWVTIFKKETDGNQSWIMNADINSNNPGYASAYLADGNYRLELNPQQGSTMVAGLARKYFDASVVSGVATITGATADGDGRWGLTPASANVTGRITDSAGLGLGGGNNKWVNINVQKFITAENRWEWGTWANTDQDGYFNISVTEAGTFRLRVEPNGYGNSAVTFSDPFTIAAGNEDSFKIAFGNIKTAAPSLKVSVLAAEGGTALQYTNIEIRKNNTWIDWANTMQNGIASISFTEAGKYQLVVNPPIEQMNAGKSRKTYNVVATADSNGVITATVTGITANGSNVFLLPLGTGTLSGTVFGSDGTTAVQNANVVAKDLSTQQERWEYAVGTSSTGKWAMTLPQGTYSIIAKAPYGGSSYGNSDAIATVTVDAAGVATLSGVAATSPQATNAFNISLKAPTWTGIVKVPTGAETGVAYAQVCLYNNDYWNCANADASGNWALSAQEGVTTYSDNSFLVYGDYRNGVYPERRFEGPTAVASALGAATGATNRELRFVGANVQITVTAGGVAVPYVWVSLDRPNVGGLGGNQTNASGVANLYVADLTKAINVRVDINNNKSVAANYTTTLKSFSDSGVTTNVSANSSRFVTSIALDTPNLRGVVREPTAGGVEGNTVPNSWVELFLASTGEWKGGSNTDENGAFSLNATKPVSGEEEYTVIVNPPWNSTGNSSRNQYSVTVSSADAVTVKVKSTQTAVSTTVAGATSYYKLALAQPSVSGTVVSSDGTTGVRNSWVVPIDSATGEWYWQQGTNSQTAGAFGLGLGNGTYKIQAQVPWNSSNLANSAMCSVTVSGGSVTTPAGGCVQSNGTIKLALRAPNVTMTLKLAGVPVAFANVGIGYGSWNVNAQSNKDGVVSLFVDSDAIKAANPSLTGANNKLWVWIDPPYGTSDMVRWDCQSGAAKPVCSLLADYNVSTAYNGGATIAMGDVEVLGPNTKLQVMDPATSTNVGANAWVALFSYESDHPEYGQRWVGGSNTDSSGFAAFNVDTATVGINGGAEGPNTRYKLEINPPWNKKVTLSQKTHSGLTLAQIAGQQFNVGTPNAVVTVKLPGGTTDNKWGWIGIEEVNASDNSWVNWIGGFGLNDTGTAAITLSPSKRYKITANPAGGRAGTMTTCYVETSASSVLSRVAGLCGASTNAITANRLQIDLYAGNVVGTVKTPSGALVANATVYANVTGATDETFAVVTSTLDNGTFGLNLDSTKSWSIKILPFNPTGATERLAVKNLASPDFVGGAYSYGDIAMGLMTP